MIISGEENKFIASQDLEVFVYIKKNKETKEYDIIDLDSYKKFDNVELNTFITKRDEIRLTTFNYYKKEILEDDKLISNLFGISHYNIAIIPKGTTCYISDDLKYIIPELLYITGQKVNVGDLKETDLSDLYKYGMDVYTKDHKRFKVTSGKYNIDDVIGIFVDKNKVMSIDKTSIYYNNINIPEKPKRYYNIDPFEDVDGYENTQLLKKYNEDIKKLCKDNWYVPAMEELLEVYKNIFKINLTLYYLDKSLIILNNESSYLSSTLRTFSTFWKLTIRNGEINIEEEDFYTYTYQSTFLFYKTE